jgi:hypothetical protein
MLSTIYDDRHGCSGSQVIVPIQTEVNKSKATYSEMGEYKCVVISQLTQSFFYFST